MQALHTLILQKMLHQTSKGAEKNKSESGNDQTINFITKNRYRLKEAYYSHSSY